MNAHQEIATTVSKMLSVQTLWAAMSVHALLDGKGMARSNVRVRVHTFFCSCDIVIVTSYKPRFQMVKLVLRWNVSYPQNLG